jgi:hypothetical protein
MFYSPFHLNWHSISKNYTEFPIKVSHTVTPLSYSADFVLRNSGYLCFSRELCVSLIQFLFNFVHFSLNIIVCIITNDTRLFNLLLLGTCMSTSKVHVHLHVYVHITFTSTSTSASMSISLYSTCSCPCQSLLSCLFLRVHFMSMLIYVHAYVHVLVQAHVLVNVHVHVHVHTHVS